MFRMLQTLEREPQEDSGTIFDSSPASGKLPFVSDYISKFAINSKSICERFPS